ncbi:WecB/TagA/CpsF family glycosyltransferase [Radicibacter daui]|uniref:WecB/TagA/CpsF family glycosyltransferase n=1 Tax=Radicibacter daui TaxID=3064829 RepID=UPI004046CF73
MSQQQVPVIDFLGLPISDIGTQEAAMLVAGRDASAPLAYVVTPNAQHMVRLARGDGAWRSAYSRAWLVLADGRVVQRFARWVLGARLPHASGSDLTHTLLTHYIQPDDSVTVIGGGERLEKALTEKFGLRGLALYDPPFGFIRDPKAVAACVDFIARHPARYIFLAVGSPQSEILARMLTEREGVTGVAMCIGGSLLFSTGLVRRAPKWVQQAGLEGLFRLLQRPKSHFKRVFVESMPILGIILAARIGKARILPAAGDAAANSDNHPRGQ